MVWGIQSVVPLIALLCCGVLLALVARQGLRRKVVRFFAFYLLAMLVWSLGAFMMYMDTSHVVLWNRVMLGGLTGMPLALFGFTRDLLKIREHQWSLFFASVAFIILLVVNTEGYLANQVRVTESGLIQYSFGPGVPPFAVYFSVLVGSSGVSLIRRLRQARDPIERNRLAYAVLGLGAVALGSLTNIVNALGAYPLDIAANVANALLLAYAIGGYQLLDIRVVARKSLLYVVPAATIAAGYFLIVYLAVTLLNLLTEQQALIISILVAAVTAVAIQPLRDAAQSWIDRLFFREQYDASLLLTRLSRAAASMLDLDRLTGIVLHEITTGMHIATAAFFLNQKESNDFLLVGQKGLEQHTGMRLTEDHPVVTWLSSHNDSLTRLDIAVMPQFKALWVRERRNLETMGAEILVPLKARGELVGILVVGAKRSEAPYSRVERLTLTTLANQVAVAIQNARLYAEMIRQKQRTETILREMFAGIVVLDRQMRILVVNPGAEAITGYSSHELIGRSLPDVLGPDPGPQRSLLYEAILRGDRLPPTEARVKVKDDVRDILFGLAPLDGAYLLSFTDITGLKEVDRLKTSIMANVSHELRTPLASIKAYTELLLEDVGGTDAAARRHFLSVIEEKADRLSSLISDLLDLARLESGEFKMREEAVSLAEVLSSAVGALEVEMWKKNIGLHLDASSAPTIVADRTLMTLLVENLISNAIKFSHEGGRVDVVSREEGGHLILEVVDQGIGIPSEEMPYLFRKFRRLQAAQEAGTEGTGLGLVLVKEAVEAHDGRIEVESAVGEGTCFRVTLPLRPSSQERDQGHDAPAAVQSIVLQGEGDEEIAHRG